MYLLCGDKRWAKKNGTLKETEQPHSQPGIIYCYWGKMCIQWKTVCTGLHNFSLLTFHLIMGVPGNLAEKYFYCLLLNSCILCGYVWSTCIHILHGIHVEVRGQFMNAGSILVSWILGTNWLLRLRIKNLHLLGYLVSLSIASQLPLFSFNTDFLCTPDWP